MKKMFEVNVEGMKEIFGSLSLDRICFELLQNAWDENTAQVDFKIYIEDNKVRIICEDDNPEGFKDLSHAYEIFSHTYKRNDPEKRGRFNIGEKQVIVCSEFSRIITTKGCYEFYPKQNKRIKRNKNTEHGTIFEGIFRIKKSELKDFENKISNIIPPKEIKTTISINDALIKIVSREFIASTEQYLLTVILNENIMRETARKTLIKIYKRDSDEGCLYEMGIPVCELGIGNYDVDIMQKIPLDINRNKVKESYLRKVRAFVLNIVSNDLTPDECNAKVMDALGDKDASLTAVKDVVEKVHKTSIDKIMFKSFDRRSDGKAADGGFVLLNGHSFDKDVRDKLKDLNIKHSSEVFKEGIAKNTKTVDLNDDMISLNNFCKIVSQKLVAKEMIMEFVYSDATYPAWFSGFGCITFNVRLIGKKYYDSGNKLRSDIIATLVHEIAHHVKDPYEEHGKQYRIELERLFGMLVRLISDNPKLLER